VEDRGYRFWMQLVSATTAGGTLRSAPFPCQVVTCVVFSAESLLKPLLKHEKQTGRSKRGKVNTRTLLPQSRVAKRSDYHTEEADNLMEFLWSL